jgi:type VI secretion system protein ImpE
MNPQQLFKAGKLNEAISSLNEQLRLDPGDSKSRTFLFELLCFSGDYDRAGRQLDVLAGAGPQSEMGALVYRGLLSAAKARQEVYSERNPSASATDSSDAGDVTKGSLNGRPFRDLVDADPRIGLNLEVFAGGSYVLIPYSLLSSVEVSPPRRLRDLLWIPAVIRTTPAFQNRELGETLLPALTPCAAKHSRDAVRLGRETVWEEDESGQLCPVGQKIFLVDGEEMPILDVRTLEFAAARAAS